LKVKGCDLAVPIPKVEYQERQANVAELLKRSHLDGVIVVGPDVFYLSGFPVKYDEAIYIQSRKEERILIVGRDRGYSTHQMEDMIYCDEIILVDELSVFSRFQQQKENKDLQQIIRKFSGAKFGIAGTHYLRSGLLTFFENIIDSSRDCSEHIWTMRRRKSQREVELLKAIYYAISDSLNEGVKNVTEGVMRGDIIGIIANTLFMHGFEELFDSFSAGLGFNIGALTFSKADHELKDGQLLTLDAGGSLYGYKGRIARTICIGEILPEHIETLQLAYSVLDIVFQSIGPDISPYEVGKSALKALLKKYSTEEVYALLHSSGVEIYEPPIYRCSGDCTKDRLEEGMIVSFELNLSLPHTKGRIGIADSFYISGDGAERLTQGIISDPPLQRAHHNFCRK
jgi:Xaa-Pro aminopeptidase